MTSSLVLREDKWTDVILKVQDQEGFSWKFPAHSTILASRSEKFRDLIEHNSHGDTPVRITVIGTDPDAMLEILRYIYTNEYPQDASPAVLVASEKFCLYDLTDHLETRLLSNLNLEQACDLLSCFEKNRPFVQDCPLRTAAMSVLQEQAFQLFSTDLVFRCSSRTLQELLISNDLMVPDESIIFWGVWRWGRRHCSKMDMPLDDGAIANYLSGYLKSIRLSLINDSTGIPCEAMKLFATCDHRRCKYYPPENSLEQSSVWGVGVPWEDLVEAVTEETVCLQMSFDKDVMLVGVTLEVSESDCPKSYLILSRESDRTELWRQEINCFKGSFRKLSRTGDPTSWLRANVLLSRPLILSREEIYSICFRTPSRRPCALLLPRSLHMRRTHWMDGTTATVHGQAVIAVQEVNIMTNAKATWKP